MERMWYQVFNRIKLTAGCGFERTKAVSSVRAEDAHLYVAPSPRARPLTVKHRHPIHYPSQHEKANVLCYVPVATSLSPPFSDRTGQALLC